jgi:Spy/CpxP family protein refolding chaperone
VTQKVYEVYKQNGWPYDHFDVEKCRAELTALQDEWDRVQKAESEARSKINRENFLKRLTPEQLKKFEEAKRLAV